MMEGPWEGCHGVGGSVTWELSMANSQPDSGDLSPTSTGNRILPTTTSSHADAFLVAETLIGDSAKPGLDFWPRDTVRSWARLFSGDFVCSREKIAHLQNSVYVEIDLGHQQDGCILRDLDRHTAPTKGWGRVPWSWAYTCQGQWTDKSSWGVGETPWKTGRGLHWKTFRHLRSGSDAIFAGKNLSFLSNIVLIAHFHSSQHFPLPKQRTNVLFIG